MKNLKLGITALALTVATTAFAQTTSNPWLIGVGAHGENHKAQANNFSNTFGAQNLTKRLFNLNNFSITPPLSKLTVARNINKYLVVDLQASVGNVGNKKFNMDKEFFLMAGLGLQFKFNGLWNEESWFDPYARVGANYLRHDYSGLTFPRTDAMNVNYYPTYNGNGDVTGKKNFFALSTGLGSNFWITKNFGLGIQGDYVTTPGDKSTVANFWQASASLLFRFGNRDRDKDGIPDKDDRCPDNPGLPEFQGCPDTDGDGIPDIDDKCPDVAGPKENQGCPWPDTDGDGVLDKDDQCVNVPGPKENNGCPWPDRDGDGIPDKDDKCPDVPGVAEYQGCPPTAERVTKELKDILFDFNKATIQSGSLSKVDAAAEVIKGAKAENFLVTGHTDAKGNAAYNLKLSKQRAASVVKALEARGVNGSQLKSVGVGSKEATVPATASNEARQADRKVEVRAISNDTEWTTYKKDDVTVAKPVKKGVKKSSKKVIKKKK
ncbi:OmpA family protein [Elizabethkingia anophelis]|uniref:OmpA family protein n=1 Tax=Elizabethkingia anophelis TaxID=1117645 RepID=UPI000840044D|nr:OmpA family protein [Elizabethkingia anophelis]MCT3660947.1 OmpA family protein [Elizabethkingia anophelis]MCT3801672.1 OmpA family protein [Elizabethkingia anophelis]MCT4058585.1 OmpA family protein [Elizabethkingia anophelis]MCT4069194.1 OmpA family protein [Elizabethkingia anophelis]MCT4119861.1 OmpA family protein [Elizabethkingia anophelis]